MKIVKIAGKQTLQITRAEWEKIGTKNGWTKNAHHQLSAEWTEFLVGQPESGMGHQRVDITFSDGSVLRDISVTNATEVDLPVACAGKVIKDIRMHRGG